MLRYFDVQNKKYGTLLTFLHRTQSNSEFIVFLNINEEPIPVKLKKYSEDNWATLDMSSINLSKEFIIKELIEQKFVAKDTPINKKSLNLKMTENLSVFSILKNK